MGNLTQLFLEDVEGFDWVTLTKVQLHHLKLLSLSGQTDSLEKIEHRAVEVANLLYLRFLEIKMCRASPRAEARRLLQMQSLQWVHRFKDLHGLTIRGFPFPPNSDLAYPLAPLRFCKTLAHLELAAFSCTNASQFDWLSTFAAKPHVLSITGITLSAVFKRRCTAEVRSKMSQDHKCCCVDFALAYGPLRVQWLDD